MVSASMHCSSLAARCARALGAALLGLLLLPATTWADEDPELAKLSELRPLAAKVAESQIQKLERTRQRLADEVTKARNGNAKTLAELEKQLALVTDAKDYYQCYLDDTQTRAQIDQLVLAMQDRQRANQAPTEEQRKQHKALCAALDTIATKMQTAEADYVRLTGEALTHPVTAVIKAREAPEKDTK